MAATDNPAGRLAALLTEAKKKPENVSGREVWASVFGVDAKDTANLLYMYAQLIQLVKTAKDSIGELDDIDQEIYQRPFTKLERVFAKANLEGRWKTTRDELDDGTMVALRFCADTLSRERGEGHLNAEVLSDLTEEIGSILERVMSDDIPNDLRVILVENLEAIRRAILEYRLRGADGLRRALETAIGSLIRHNEEIKKHRDRKPLKEYLDFLARLNDVVAVGLKTKQLLAPVVQYFLSSGEN